MKKLISSILLIFVCAASLAQVGAFSQVQIGNRRINSISNDSSFANKSSVAIPTEWAVYEYFTNHIKNLRITTGHTYVKDNVDSMLAITDSTGTICVRTDSSISFVLQQQPATDYNNWVQLLNAASVPTVFGRSGAIVAQEGDYSSFYPVVSGSYVNPPWITSLPWSKLTETPYVADSTALKAYAGSATTVHMQGPQAGDFYYSSTGTPDGGNAFSRAGGGYWIRRYSGLINVDWFGAIGDSSTVNNTAIRNAVNFANGLVSSGKTATIWFPEGGKYVITDSIYIPANIGVKMDAPVYYQGTTDRPAIVIGSASAVSANKQYKLNVVSSVQSDWSDTNNIGLKLINLNACDVYIVGSFGFTIGVKCVGEGNGWVYNNVSIGTLQSNKIALDIFSKSGGWVNENSWFGGRFSETSTTRIGQSRYGIVISGSGYYNNNNNFYKPSFELYGAGASPGECVPIDILWGTQNNFTDVRDEGNTDGERNIFARTLNASAYNKINLGYGTGILLDSSSSPSSIIIVRSSQMTQGNSNVYNSGDLTKRINPYNATQWYAQNELFFASTSTSTVYHNMSDTNYIHVNSGYVAIGPSRGLCVRLTTDKYKRYVLKRSTVKGHGGYVAFRCYDSTGSILYSAGTKYVIGQSNYGVNPSGNFGGSYSTGTSSSSDLFFQIDSAVDHLDVILYNIGDSADLKSFKIQCLDGNATVMDLKTRNGAYATQAPAFGTWEQGTIVYNTSPTSTSNIGWICTAAGTPGTWTSFGTPTQMGSTSYLQKVVSANVLGNSLIYDDGTHVVIGVGNNWNGLLTLENTTLGTSDFLAFYNHDGTYNNRVKFSLVTGVGLTPNVVFSSLFSSGNYANWTFQKGKVYYSENPTMVDKDSLAHVDKKYADSLKNVIQGLLNAKQDTGTFYFNVTRGILYDSATHTFSLDSAYIRDSIMAGTTATSGTYTPTLTNTSNVASSSLVSATYQKAGNIVTVRVAYQMVPTAANTSTILTITLPFTTSTASQIGAGGGTYTNGDIPVLPSSVDVVSTTTAQIYTASTNTNNTAGSVIFQYTL